MEHDVFISYSSKNFSLTETICNRLEDAGIKCWMAPRDIPPGSSYAEEIPPAIKAAKVFLLVFSQFANQSEYVLKELSTAIDSKKTVIPFLIENTEMSEGFKFLFQHCQWITGYPKPEEKIDDLKNEIKQLLYAKPSGDKEVVVKRVEPGQLKISMGSQSVIKPDSYDELLAVLNENNVSTIKWDLQEFAIGDLTNDLFDFLTGKLQFNQAFTIRMIEAVAGHSAAAGKFYEMATKMPQWQQHEQILDKAREIISFSFVGVLGKQLSKLMAIGKEDQPDLKKYVEKCYQIVQNTIDLLSFAFLSKLWDDIVIGKIHLDDNEKSVIRSRLETIFVLSFEKKIDVLSQFIRIYSDRENTDEMPLPEIDAIYSSFAHDGDIYRSCIHLKNMSGKGEKTTLFDCFIAEKELTAFFIHFAFLAKYRMISMKEISYRKIRNKKPNYLHQYVALGIDSSAHVDAEMSKLADAAVFTDAVLLYKGDDYQCCINLYPFVIDYNALSFEQGTRICFFSSQEFMKEVLMYICMDDNSQNKLEKSNKTDVNFLSNEDMKKFNVDCIIDTFNEMFSCFR